MEQNDFVVNKYISFYKKHGYYPRYFEPYNCRELVIAPTLSTNFTMSGAGVMLVMENADEK